MDNPFATGGCPEWDFGEHSQHVREDSDIRGLLVSVVVDFRDLPIDAPWLFAKDRKAPQNEKIPRSLVWSPFGWLQGVGEGRFLLDGVFDT